ncbi:MAG: hypothetical protein U0174_15940 [Polyangiaceae bacterium]
MQPRSVLPVALVLLLGLSAIACGGSVRDTGSSGSSDSIGAPGSSSSSGSSGTSGTSSSSGSSGASGSSGSSGGEVLPTFTENVCKKGTYAPLADVTFQGVLGQADYIELRDEVNPEDVQGGTSGANLVHTTAVDSRGSLCKGADDPEACKARFEALRSHAGFIRRHPGGAYRPNSHMYIAYTRGSDVGIVDTAVGVMSAVQPVVSIENAALIVTLVQDHYFSCTSPQVALQKDEFLFDARKGAVCGGGVYALVDHVTSVTGAFRSDHERLVTKAEACP